MYLQQLIQLPHQPLEVLKRRLHGCWAFHIDAGVAEEVEGELRAAFEEGP